MTRFVFILFLLLVPVVAHAQPSISFKTMEYDFGLMSQDDKAEHIFEFSNKGDRQLVIDKLTAS